MSAAAMDSMRVLVVGDSGVGKSCLVQRLALGKPPHPLPEWTLGCAPQVCVHRAAGCDVFVELYDIGGASQHAPARRVFFRNFDGIMLVHDLGNSVSHANLLAWLSEIAACADAGEPDELHEGGQAGGDGGDAPAEFDLERYVGSAVGAKPLLIVGTKADLLRAGELRAQSKAHQLLCATGAACVDVCALRPADCGSAAFAAFFDRVLASKEHR